MEISINPGFGGIERATLRLYRYFYFLFTLMFCFALLPTWIAGNITHRICPAFPEFWFYLRTGLSYTKRANFTDFEGICDGITAVVVRHPLMLATA